MQEDPELKEDQLHSEVEVSLCYGRPCLKINKHIHKDTNKTKALLHKIWVIEKD